MISETVKPLFDYGDIREAHTAAADEIANMCLQFGQPEIAAEIKRKFKIVEVPRYNLEDSEFVQECKKHGMYVSVQGILHEGQGPSLMEYQLIGISGDVRKMNEFIKAVKGS
jgi:hypothetical protein